MSDISEAASEKVRRGRPPAFTDEEIALYRNIGATGDIHTRRGQVDYAYRMHALSVLRSSSEADRFVWLADFDAMRAGRPHAWRPSILTELGRWKDDEAILMLAEKLCTWQPKTKEAIAWLRHNRLSDDYDGTPPLTPDEMWEQTPVAEWERQGRIK